MPQQPVRAGVRRVGGALRWRWRRIREELFLWRWRSKVQASRFAHFGKRSLIVSPRGILARHRIEIGDDVLVHEDAMFSVVESFNGRDHEPYLRIGSGSNIGPRIWFSCVGEIEIGDNTLISHDVLIADSYHEYENLELPIIRQPMAPPESVKLGSGCYVGAHAAILAGVTVGQNTFIGANAVVTQSVPANAVVVGNPARVIRHYDHQRGAWVDGAPAG
jgi:acetyltransferase-like isoleucine patch superfamily enzyme